MMKMSFNRMKREVEMMVKRRTVYCRVRCRTVEEDCVEGVV
jgi:hypothetical protein